MFTEAPRLQHYPQWRRSVALALMAVLLTLLPAAAEAQTPFSPDRPGLGNGASVVPVGHVMVELGLPALEQEEFGASARGWSASFPALVRVGITPRVELRLGGPMYHVLRIDDAPELDAEGFGDIEVGAKIALPIDEPFFVTDVALLPAISLPIGDDAFSADGVGASLSAAGNWLGWWAIGFGTTSGIALLPDGDDYDVGGQFAVSASHGPAPWLSLFVEAAYYPVIDAANEVYAGAGFTVTPLPNVQLDAYVDAGLNDVSTDYLYGAGLAFQL